MLRARPAPHAPAEFTIRTLGRIRRARWRSDQLVDASFNVAIAFIVLGVAIGIWMLLHRSGLAAVGGDAVDLFGTGLVAFARRVAASLPLYVVATALGIWWWAERDVQI
jgi:hypothetical protein